MNPTPHSLSPLPFHFVTGVFFVFGTIVGSFLNVCIHRMPLGLSVVHPPSHCPGCGRSIPWYLNIPLVTWLWLKGRCAFCQMRISPRYLGVELLTGILFAACWLSFGTVSATAAAAYCLLMAGFIVATFIDFEHFIIPDEITLGGMGAGLLASYFVPALHSVQHPADAMRQSFYGLAVGAGLLYGVLRAGKLLFGRERIAFPAETRIVFTEEFLALPDQQIPYEELFYRKSDTIRIEARHICLPDRCFTSGTIRLSPAKLRIDDEVFPPETVPHMELVADGIILPREAMGFGDVKFMGAIGAFLGWPATFFSLMASSILGSMVGIGAIVLRRREWSSRIPYGPYIALAAVIWVFIPHAWRAAWDDTLRFSVLLLRRLVS